MKHEQSGPHGHAGAAVALQEHSGQLQLGPHEQLDVVAAAAAVVAVLPPQHDDTGAPVTPHPHPPSACHGTHTHRHTHMDIVTRPRNEEGSVLNNSKYASRYVHMKTRTLVEHEQSGPHRHAGGALAFQVQSGQLQLGPHEQLEVVAAALWCGDRARLSSFQGEHFFTEFHLTYRICIYYSTSGPEYHWI